jgi:hypothetical protein
MGQQLFVTIEYNKIGKFIGKLEFHEHSIYY